MGGITSHWRQKGRLVRKGGCEFVLQGKMHSRGVVPWNWWKGYKNPQRPGRDPKLVLSVIMSFISTCWHCLSQVASIWLNGKGPKRTWLCPRIQKWYPALEADLQFESVARTVFLFFFFFKLVVCFSDTGLEIIQLERGHDNTHHDDHSIKRPKQQIKIIVLKLEHAAES